MLLMKWQPTSSNQLIPTASHSITDCSKSPSSNHSVMQLEQSMVRTFLLWCVGQVPLLTGTITMRLRGMCSLLLVEMKGLCLQMLDGLAQSMTKECYLRLSDVIPQPFQGCHEVSIIFKVHHLHHKLRANIHLFAMLTREFFFVQGNTYLLTLVISVGTVSCLRIHMCDTTLMMTMARKLPFQLGGKRLSTTCTQCCEYS